MKMERRPVAIRKSDLTPAFKAAKAAGYDQVTIVVDTADGQRFQVTATCGVDADGPPSPLKIWRAGLAES